MQDGYQKKLNTLIYLGIPDERRVLHAFSRFICVIYTSVIQ